MITKHSNIRTLEHSRGVALYLAIIILSIILSLALGLNAITLGRLKTSKGIGDAVISFYAAESGIERALFEKWAPPSPPKNGSLVNGASYKVHLTAPGGSCPAIELCIKSVGTFQNTNRAIRVIR